MRNGCEIKEKRFTGYFLGLVSTCVYKLKSTTNSNDYANSLYIYPSNTVLGKKLEAVYTFSIRAQIYNNTNN